MSARWSIMRPPRARDAIFRGFPSGSRGLGAPVAELVDATDSKSVVRKDVLVRVRPGVPIISMGCVIFQHTPMFIFL